MMKAKIFRKFTINKLKKEIVIHFFFSFSLSNTLSSCKDTIFHISFLSPPSSSSSLSSASKRVSFKFPKTPPFSLSLSSRKPPSKEDRAVWYVEKLDWQAQLSLDVTDLYRSDPKLRLSGPVLGALSMESSKKSAVLNLVGSNQPVCNYAIHNSGCRYSKSAPGNLEKDMERRFSYALSREDIENAVLGGP